MLLEVTESAFLEDGPRALSVLEKTKALGVGLVLDDFGTGYSSLSYLAVSRSTSSRSTRASSAGSAPTQTRKIVAAIIDLAHALDLSVVAEGIETEEQLSEVTSLGSDRAQGYYLCRPMLVDQIDRRVLQPAGDGTGTAARPSGQSVAPAIPGCRGRVVRTEPATGEASAMPVVRPTCRRGSEDADRRPPPARRAARRSRRRA